MGKIRRVLRGFLVRFPTGLLASLTNWRKCGVVSFFDGVDLVESCDVTI